MLFVCAKMCCARLIIAVVLALVPLVFNYYKILITAVCIFSYANYAIWRSSIQKLIETNNYI